MHTASSDVWKISLGLESDEKARVKNKNKTVQYTGLKHSKSDTSLLDRLVLKTQT